MMIGLVPEPVYYMGWIIQPVPNGFYVYGRQDYTSSKKGRLFSDIRDAYKYIDRETIRG